MQIENPSAWEIRVLDDGNVIMIFVVCIWVEKTLKCVRDLIILLNSASKKRTLEKIALQPIWLVAFHEIQGSFQLFPKDSETTNMDTCLLKEELYVVPICRDVCLWNTKPDFYQHVPEMKYKYLGAILGVLIHDLAHFA